MTVHRVKMCSCGHEESWHDEEGNCRYGHDHAMGGCSCTKFSRRRRADVAKPSFVMSSMPTPIEQAIDDIICGFTALKTALVVARSAPIIEAAPATVTPKRLDIPKARREQAAEVKISGDAKLKLGERKMLATLAQYPKLTRTQLGTFVGIRARGRTFTAYLSTLRTRGLVEVSGEDLQLTDAGRKLTPAPAKITRGQVIDMWKSRLKAGERNMLDAVLDAHTMSRADLARVAKIDLQGRTFTAYLSTLRCNDLIVVAGDTIKLGPALARAS